MSLPEPPWQRRAARRRSAKRPLSLDVIVRTAVSLLDEEGLDAVSMRRVAQELGTGAASLYAYVGNKDELHELVLDQVMGEMNLPEPDPARWQEQVKEIGREQLRVLCAHPGIAQVPLGTPLPTGPNAMLATEALLAILRSSGLSDRLVSFAGDLLALYPTAIAMERSTSFGLTDTQLTERMTQVDQYLATLPAERFPTIVALRLIMGEGSADERFDFGLDVLVRGLASYVDEPAD